MCQSAIQWFSIPLQAILKALQPQCSKYRVQSVFWLASVMIVSRTNPQSYVEIAMA